MDQTPFTFLASAISQLLSTNSAAIESTGLNLFRGLAVILIAWFGVKSALSSASGHRGFDFAKFADLLLIIAFGLGMLTYYSTAIPGTTYSFSDLITQEALQLSATIESNQTQTIADAISNAEQQLGTPPGVFSIHEELTYFFMTLALAATEAVAFAVVAYGYVAAAVCVLIGPIFIPFFIVPQLDFLFWGWFKAFIGFSFYQVVASAFIFVFAKVLLAMLGVIGPLTLSNAFVILPSLFVTLMVCVFGLFKIPELTASILGGRAGTWVNLLGGH